MVGKSRLYAKTPNEKKSKQSLQIQRKKSSKPLKSPIDRFLFLQRTIGNQAVERLINSGALQAKLKIGQPKDKYEQEADCIADQVMAMPNPRLQRQPENEEEEEMVQTKPLADQITPLVQRQEKPPEEEEEPVQAKLKDGEMLQRPCPECEEETAQRQPEEDEDEELQAKSKPGETPEVIPAISSGIPSLQGGGKPLSGTERNFFEPRFRADFSNVRVHNDTRAASVARLVNARAFTLGRSVVFGAGEYSPDALAGRKLLAHELTHVVQQNSGLTLFSPCKNSENTRPNSQELSIVSPELLIQKQQVIQRTGPTDEERYVNTLTNAGTTRAVWDADYIDDQTFLGVNIRGGIHQELADRLTLAETFLRDEHPGRTDAQTATEIGLNTLSGKRPIRNAVGGRRLSNHSYGIAIDVNYSANPYIGRSAAVNDIINRISQLMTGNSFQIRTPQAGTSEEIRARFSSASQAFAAYFNMRGDRVAIRQLVIRRGLVSSPEPPEGLIDPWREEEIDNKVDEIYNQIEADATNTDLLNDMEMTDLGQRPLTGGFIDLSEQLVEALSNRAGLRWGAEYRRGKDIMHFDWRNGTIRTGHRQ